MPSIVEKSSEQKLWEELRHVVSSNYKVPEGLTHMKLVIILHAIAGGETEMKGIF